MGTSSEHHFRRFVACRDAGDEAGADHHWSELIALESERVRQFVRAWGHSGKLSRDEQEEAYQGAMIRVWRKLRHSFTGSHPGEFVNALRRLVSFACTDVQREAATLNARTAWADETDAEGHSVWAEPIAETRRADHERAEAAREAADALAWAIPLISDDRRRRVVERTLEGAEATEIADELGVTVENLYQLRRRGLNDLAEVLKEQWDA